MFAHDRTRRPLAERLRPRPEELRTGSRYGWEVSGRALAEGLADRVDDAVRLERLDHEVLGAELDRLEHLRLLAERRAHDDLRGRVRGHDLRQGREPVLLRHRDVERDEVGLQRLELRERLDAVAGLADHLVAALGQRIADHLAHEGGVVDDEDAGHGCLVPEFASRYASALPTASMTRSGWNGLTTKSLAPSLIASSTFDSWPRAEHMTTFADGSAAMMSARAARPSFSGMVMSSVIRSGLSAWNCASASTPLPASPTTSWPPLARASLTIFRMNAASSTTSTRAIVNSIPSLRLGVVPSGRERDQVIDRASGLLSGADG